MQSAIDEVNRRREKQLAYNAAHGITPRTIEKAIRRGIEQEIAAGRTVRKAAGTASEKAFDRDELEKLLEEEMLDAAKSLEFEKAARLRDQLERVRRGGEVDLSEEPRRTEKPGEPGSRAGRTGPRRRKASR